MDNTSRNSMSRANHLKNEKSFKKIGGHRMDTMVCLTGMPRLGVSRLQQAQLGRGQQLEGRLAYAYAIDHLNERDQNLEACAKGLHVP